MISAAGRLNVKNEELEDMVKEAPGPINFTVFLTMFGEKLKGKAPLGDWRGICQRSSALKYLSTLQIIIMSPQNSA